MKIGVFDSGVGGKSIAKAIKNSIQNVDVLLIEDKKNLPYGTKTKDQLLKLVTPILKDMEKRGCEVIVIACNTVTTNIITELRQSINTPLVGIEPMIKPASLLTKSGKITVCATSATINSQRYKSLKSEYLDNIEVYEPDCSSWASMVEDNEIDEKQISSIVQTSKQLGSDVIVLGCTHYHWIYEIIDELSGDQIKVLQPTDAVLDQLKRVMSQLR